MYQQLERIAFLPDVQFAVELADEFMYNMEVVHKCN